MPVFVQPSPAKLLPDLSVSEALFCNETEGCPEWSNGGDVAASAGDQLNLTYYIQYLDHGRFGNTCTRFYLSPDETRGSADIRLDRWTYYKQAGGEIFDAAGSEDCIGKKEWKASGSETLIRNTDLQIDRYDFGFDPLHIPENTVPGNYYLLICVDDAKPLILGFNGNDVAERVGSNNCFAVDGRISVSSFVETVSIGVRVGSEVYYEDGIVRSGTELIIAWTTDGSDSCTLTGPGITATTGVTDGSELVVVTHSSTYTITCGAQSDSIVINVTPSVEEN